MGRFCPPHRGHDYLIEASADKCDKLTLIVIGNNRDEAYLPLALRVGWLRERFESERIRVVAVATDLPDSHGDPAIIAAWARLIEYCAGGAVDRFFSSEAHTYGDWTASALGAEHVCVDPDRSHVPISATIIRTDPLAAVQYLDPPVRAYFEAQAAQAAGAESRSRP
jgi:HTH-type transcriptional regulator, transcriptional repressor of NAD biosynthesis genes